MVRDTLRSYDAVSGSDKALAIAVVLAGGRGSRMKSDTPKQYLPLEGIPLLAYSLKRFEECDAVDGIVLVTGNGEIDWCKENIVKFYGFHKVLCVTAGGKERWQSVHAGLCKIKNLIDCRTIGGCSYVLIHDGARPLLDEPLLQRNLACAREKGCAVTGMPVKDTIKICREDGSVVTTPDRSVTWLVQTPQTFLFDEILEAYDCLAKEAEEAIIKGNAKTEKSPVTDDAMVMERFGKRQVYMCEGSYRNIKITTPEDLEIAGQYLSSASSGR